MTLPRKDNEADLTNLTDVRKEKNGVKRYTLAVYSRFLPPIVTHRDALVRFVHFIYVSEIKIARSRSLLTRLSLFCKGTFTDFFSHISFSLNYRLPGALMYLNEATLLNNIRTRYFKDRIYVSNYNGAEVKSLRPPPPFILNLSLRCFRLTSPTF